MNGQMDEITGKIIKTSLLELQVWASIGKHIDQKHRGMSTKYTYTDIPLVDADGKPQEICPVCGQKLN